MPADYRATKPGDAAVGKAKNISSPPAREVDNFHRYSDLNARKEAQHHSLGTGANQASTGDHNHRDGNGRPLLDDVTFTLSRSLNTAAVLKQVIDALVLLGATDTTTP